MDDWDQRQRRAFIRMKRAHDTGKGVRLSFADLEALNITFLGEVWSGVAEDALSRPTPEHKEE